MTAVIGIVVEVWSPAVADAEVGAVVFVVSEGVTVGKVTFEGLSAIVATPTLSVAAGSFSRCTCCDNSSTGNIHVVVGGTVVDEVAAIVGGAGGPLERISSRVW